MPKSLLLILALSVIILTAAVTLIFNENPSKIVPKSEAETAVNQAKYLFSQKKLLGEDFSNGPCLSNALLPGWVLDIAHTPRENLDDLPENQCPAYLQGSATHFVELDLEGNLIRVK